MVPLSKIVLAALLALRIWSVELTRFAFVPRGAFEAQAPLRAGVYEDPAMWVSRPGTTDDPAQYRPEGETDFKTADTGNLPPPGQDQVSIQCYNGPEDEAHWIRFEDFCIKKIS